jgi:hypothetical protein
MRHANDNATEHVIVETLPDGREVAVRAPLPVVEPVKDEAYYRRACALLDVLFGAQLVEEMPADVRAAFERLERKRAA